MESLTRIDLPLIRIRAEKFCLRESVEDSSLTDSVRQFGLLQPLTVVQNGKFYDCVSGHKRLHALKKLKKKTVPVDLLSTQNPKKLFLIALLLNQPASFSDLDRVRVILKAETFFLFSILDLQNLILPRMGLVSSPKVLSQYQKAARLPSAVHQMIRLNHLPFHGSFWLAQFKATDLNFLITQVLPTLRPSASQLAHICEWLLDLTQTQAKSVAWILKKDKRFLISQSKDIRAHTDFFYQTLRSLRFPDLAAKEKAFSQAAKELKGQVRGLEIRAPDHFEEEGFYIRAHIQNSKSLADVLQRLQDVQAQASTLFDTLL